MSFPITRFDWSGKLCVDSVSFNEVINDIGYMHKALLYLSLRQHMAIQVLFSVAIISILIFVALKEYEVPIIKARLAAALFTTGVLKQEITLFYAERGRWPDKEDLKYYLKTNNDEYQLNDIDVKNGSFKIAVDTGNKALGTRYIAFNRVEVAESKSATVMWGCGNNTYPDGVIYYRELQDNLNERIMPSICKGTSE
jgi:Tfp pilus assembly protein PilE